MLKKILVAPDSFKGSATAEEICAYAQEAIHKVLPGCETVLLPIADGGEGTVSCLQTATGGTLVPVTVQNLYGEDILVQYLRTGDTAVVEMAAMAGIGLMHKNNDSGAATTFGVGQAVKHAVAHGARKIVLALGGSATNDAGCGCAAALGVRFYDAENTAFVPVGNTLERIARIDVSQAQVLLQGCELSAMCDVSNPMHGKTGAAFVFAPQKGANATQVTRLDAQLKHLDDIIKSQLSLQVADAPGAGAAGAFGAGILAFLGGTLRSGIDTVLDLVQFDVLLQGADLVLTGEGKTDEQSLHGKVISGLARRTQPQGVPLVVLSGAVDISPQAAYNIGVTALFSAGRAGVPYPACIERFPQDYKDTLCDILHTIVVFSR